MRALLRFLPLFAGIRRPLALAVLLSLITLMAGIGLLGLSGWFLTAAALATTGSAFNLFVPSAGVRGLSFIRILARYGERLVGHDATLRLLSDLRVWLFARVFPLLPLPASARRGDLVQRLLADVDALDTIFLVALGPLLTALIAGALVTLVLGMVLPGAALAYALAMTLAILAVPLFLVRANRRLAAIAATASADLRGQLIDSVDGRVDLIAFAATGRAEAACDAAAQTLARANRRAGRLGAAAAAMVQALAGLATLGVLVAGVEAVSAGRLDGPLMAGLLLAVVASFEGSAMLVRSAARLAAAFAAAERLDGLATRPPAVAEPGAPAALPEGGRLSFENVTFGYDAARPVLRDFSLSIGTGERVAITGASGIGKSTLAHLALRLALPQAGAVKVNRVDIAQATSEAVAERVALMVQDPPVFLDTIRANLLIGAPDADDAALWQALADVRLDTFVDTLPDGLETYVGEAGRTLSVGQARRLCLARTLLSGADILILDEPTSGLDAEAEAALLADLPALAGGRTLIVITHARHLGGMDRVIRL